ncbi:hypothetical protein JCM16776_0959 [Leptotrichia shahii]|uniref:Uncharacterized protein n=1 Tax=Leptotrichia shahii TaxID=157691 RepID=A0A510JN07_9FUSO|nr:hypothetical protein [Leptotrichia shahii]BBM40739.1 hypothetical protein JCM16776_0959 [Leptotrichia shahii]
MLKKRQKMLKISQIISILMSEKNSVTLINKGFSQKYGKSSISIKTRIETASNLSGANNFSSVCKSSISIKTR